VSASSTFLVRSGMSPIVTTDGRIVYGERGPDIYAHVQRRGLHVEWEITAGPTGEPLASGETWTRGGANVAAIAAAHHPRIGKEAAQ
jgi:hypothetical protein